MKKQLPTAGITQELSQSVFFTRVTDEKAFPKKSIDKTERPNARTGERAGDRTERSNARPIAGAPDQVKDHSLSHSEEGDEPLSDAPISRSVQPPHPTGERVPTPTTRVSAENTSRILERLRHGYTAQKEKTERYSFEIYPQQKEKIEDFLYQYKKQTGEKLSASKVIREAIDLYFQLLDQNGSR